MDAASYDLTPLTVFGNRNIVIALTPMPFEIYILADVLLILCRVYLMFRGWGYVSSEISISVFSSGSHIDFQWGELPSLPMYAFFN